MKPFMNMFMVSQEAEGIEWSGRSSGSSMDDEDEKEKVDAEGSDEGEAADDEAMEDNDATPYANTTEDNHCILSVPSGMGMVKESRKCRGKSVSKESKM
ncbi:hypothetical protein PVK06_027685 [Gossypium arboreum]|uniref:Uncharacterized protein n=1 Tax=Gossypium arboreum TaxID=29729 RepID=A0ABR0P282_GOSAR|nr:hypothetical protein PVK06_027685 [Gossypium arboreum]